MFVRLTVGLGGVEEATKMYVNVVSVKDTKTILQVEIRSIGPFGLSVRD